MVPVKCAMVHGHAGAGGGLQYRFARKMDGGLSRARRGLLPDAIRQALEAAGVEFTNGERPGVRLRSGGR